MHTVFIEEKFKLKITGLLINLVLIFGLLLVPESEMPVHLPAWYNQLDLYLTLILGIPLIWQTHAVFRKTGLKLDSQGIEENIGFKTEKFLWNEIVNIRFMKIYFLKYILIYIQDPKSYMEKQSAFRKLSMKSHLKRFGTPIRIPIHAINKSPQDIANIISEYTKSLMQGKT